MSALKNIRNVLRILWNVLAGIVLLTILLAILIQTPIFKSWIRGYLERRITSELQGTLKLGEIHGNFLTHIIIDSVELSCGNERVISTGPVEANYNLLPLLKNGITISELHVRNPRVVFRRPQDGGWNIGMLFKPSGDTSSPAPFPLTIDVGQISIDSGSFSLTDSLTLSDTSHRFIPGTLEYHDFRATDITLSAGIHFTASRIDLDLRHLSGKMNGSEFRLDTLRGNFVVSNDSAIARNVTIRTGNSRVLLDAAMQHIDLFGHILLEDMRTNPTQLRLRAGAVDFAELAWFLHPLSFLHGSAAADIDAGGTFGDLAIRKLTVETYKSSVSISGRLRNLDRPERLTIDATIGRSRIFPPDAARLLPPFGIPKFSGMGMTTISGEYRGTPLNFRSVIQLDAPSGSLHAEGGLNLETGTPGYDAIFTVSNFDVNPLLELSNFPTRLFAHGEISGSGFTLDDIQSRLQVLVDSGVVRNLRLDPSSIYLVASPHRMETVTNAAAHGMRIGISGTYDTQNPGQPSFSADMELQSVDLALVLDEPKLETDLTLRGNVSGTGTNLDDLNARATLTLLPSVIFSHSFGEDTVRFKLVQHRREPKELSLRSSVADVEINGAFDLHNLGGPLVDQCLSVFNKVVDHTILQDSGDQTELPRTTAGRSPARTAIENDFTYSLRVKDLQAVSTLIEGRPFNAEGSMSGRVKGNGAQIAMSGKGEFANFFIGNIRGGVLFRDTRIGFDIQNDAGTTRLDRIAANISLNVGNINSSLLTIDSLRSSLYVDNERGVFSITCLLDSLYSVSTRGVASVQPQTYVFDIDSLEVAAMNDSWRNREDVQLRLNRNGLRIMRAEMVSGDESILVQGGINDSGTFDVRASLNDVSLEHFGSFSRDTSTFRPETGFQGHIDARISLSGRSEAPVIDIQAQGSGFAFRRAPIGPLSATASYSEKQGLFKLFTQEQPNDSSVSFSFEGAIPLDLSFSAVERRFLREAQHIRITANRFDVGMFQPLVPDLRDLRGLMSCDIVIGGSPDQPEYSGNISIPEARFTFSANNISYIGSGEMKPSGQKILLDNFLLKNTPQDNPRGALRVNGFIAVRNYNIDDFDLKAHGDLLFMSDASRRVIQLLYGTLYAETDTGGLRVRGTLDAPVLSGGLLVKYADLILPQRGATTQGGSYNSLQYSTIDDTTRSTTTRRSLSSAFYAVIDSLILDNARRQSTPHLRFIDRLRYDFTVETEGQTHIKMVITPSTKEELSAELQGKVNIINQTGEHTIYGAVSVIRPSYYNFLKQFDATGTLRFAGPWDNPRLDIRATYEGSRILPASTGGESNQSAGSLQKVLVLLDITGSRYEPHLEMSIKLISANGDTTDRGTQAVGELQSDAISFILTGKFRDDLNSQDRQSIYSNLEQTATSSVLTGVSSSLSTYLTDFVRQELPFIRRAEVMYGGGSFGEGTSVNIVGDLGYGTWRVAGRVFNKIGSANVNYQMSLGDILEKRFLRNLFLELERRVEGSDNTGDEKATNSARIYYRISF